ncbi:MAG TPA: sigma-70 family RNA polymerase sigma factor [Candidatus Limnocylindrales bacterium]|nr:sigma-70 family RNA polymerase sigma factor [Candidatus Limnocylindrales bacterium]
MFGGKNIRLKTFEQITLPYLKDLYNFARKLTKNENDAEDLTQETYLRAFEKFDQFKPGTNAKGWLFAIMYHLFIDSRKKAENRYTFVEMEKARYINEDPTHFRNSFLCLDSTEEDLQKFLTRVKLEDIKNALNHLPEPYKTVMILRDFHGFSYREIAEITELPVGTVMSRLSRGRRLLKEKILKNLPPEE